MKSPSQDLNGPDASHAHACNDCSVAAMGRQSVQQISAENDDLVCQLYDLEPAGVEFTPRETLWLRVRKWRRHLLRSTAKVARDPVILWEKLRSTLAHSRMEEPPNGDGSSESLSNHVRLNLQPGELVRVRPLQAILSTLDDGHRFEGMGFMKEMEPFCGGTYTVRKRVDRFFDERNQKLLKLRNAVILDNVFCEPLADSRSPYAGCARTCYLFWKEAWLERLEESAN